MHKLRDSPGETEEDLRAKLKDIARKNRVYVLGLGNTDRADDGAGVLVAKALKKLFPSYAYSEHDGVEGTVLDISEKNEDAVVFFVDAAELHMAAGAIRVSSGHEIKDTEITTHRVAVALMASMLERAGKRVAVIGIQPKKIEFRGEVTAPVLMATESVFRVLSDIMRANDA